MSWEAVSETERPCPFGADVYVAVVEIDDWNRTRSHWTMSCRQCQEDYVCMDGVAYPSGLRTTTHRWVRRDAYREYKRLSQAADDARSRAAALARSRYLARWLGHFEGLSKKECWRVLTKDGARYPGLGTFYKHTRQDGLETCLARFFRDHTKEALVIIGVSDPDHEQLLEKADDLLRKAHSVLNEKPLQTVEN